MVFLATVLVVAVCAEPAKEKPNVMKAFLCVLFDSSFRIEDRFFLVDRTAGCRASGRAFTTSPPLSSLAFGHSLKNKIYTFTSTVFAALAPANLFLERRSLSCE